MELPQHRAASATPALLAGLGTLRLRFQPIVTMADGRLVGLESLARLCTPNGEIIQPDEFVPQMEQAGTSTLLVEQVSDRALADTAQVVAAKLVDAGFHIGINLPLDCLLARDTVASLDEVRTRHGMPAEQVMLELTESQRAADIPALRAAVTAFRQAGYRVAIDDVVPDLPDLDALLEMPFTAVKFDKSLARGGLDGRPPARGFIDKVIAIAQRRHMTVIAEGIEDCESWVSLRDCGVTYGQGYWVSPPLSYAELPGWIADWNLRRARLP